METSLLSDADRAFLLALARSAVRGRVLGETDRPESPPATRTGEPGAAFVTLRLEGQLRGCIGVVQATRDVRTVVAEMAVRAAASDPRFPPVSPAEIDGLTYEISVLSEPVEVSGPEDVEVGVHGVIVTQGASSGLLLPQVATDRGWTALELVENTCRKAGLDRAAWRDRRTRIEVFRAEVFGEESPS